MIQRIQYIRPQKPSWLMLWIHGLDYDVARDKSYLLSLGLPASLLVIIPQAPLRDVTVLGRKASSWFDIKDRSAQSFNPPMSDHFSIDQIKESSILLLQLLQKELKESGLDYQNVILAGFSQGCGMSFHLASLAPKAVNHVIGVAGYLFQLTKIRQCKSTLLYGGKDELRPWQIVRKTWADHRERVRIIMVAEMGHQYKSCRTQLGDVISGVCS